VTPAFTLVRRSPLSFARFILSLINASRKTATSGPFPDRYTAGILLSLSCCSTATLNPTNVLPAPGTPVTKHIDFFWFAFASSTISKILLQVSSIFFAEAAVLVILSTVWFLNMYEAASMIVGVGEYALFPHPAGSKSSVPNCALIAPLMTSKRLLLLHSIGL